MPPHVFRGLPPHGYVRTPLRGYTWAIEHNRVAVFDFKRGRKPTDVSSGCIVRMYRPDVSSGCIRKTHNVMANTLVKIYVHVVFHVKKTRIIMRKADLPRIFEYIGGILRNHDSMALAVGGIENHVHILMTLPKTQTLSDLVRTVKAVSSGWIKSIDPDYYNAFAWQDGYGAFSVSSSVLANTVKYINGQEEHHKTDTYEDEYRRFLKAYNIECDEKYIFDS